MFGVPPEHSAIDNIHLGIFCYWVLLHYNTSFETIAGGFNGALHCFLMVWSTFWRSRKNLTNLPKLSCGFKCPLFLAYFIFLIDFCNCPSRPRRWQDSSIARQSQLVAGHPCHKPSPPSRSAASQACATPWRSYLEYQGSTGRYRISGQILFHYSFFLFFLYSSELYCYNWIC